MAKWYIPRRNEQERDEEKDKFAQQVSDPFHTNRSQEKAESIIKTPQKSVTDNSPEIEQKAEEFKNNLSMPQKSENTPKKSDIKQNANRWYVTEGRDKDGVRTKSFESEEARRHRLGDEAVDTGYDRYALAHAWEQTDEDQSLFDRYKQLKASAKQEEDRQHELRVREAEEKKRQDEEQIAGLSEEEVALLDKYNSQFTHDRPYTTEEKKIAKHYYDVDLDSEPKQSKEEVKEEFMAKTGMDEEAFDQIAHIRDVQKNAQDREEQRTSLKDEMDNKSTAGIIFSSRNAASVLGNTFGGIPAAAGVGQDLAKDREKIDTNRYTYNMVNQARDYREAAANELNERYGDVAGFLYQAGMSHVDSRLMMPLKGIGLTMQAITSAANTLQDAQNRGIDRNHALAESVIAGVIEAYTEKKSLDKGFEILRDRGVKALRTELGKMVTSIGVEASEEGYASVLNAVADLIINGDESQYRQTVREYEKQGLSEKDARKQAAKDWTLGTLEEMAAGGIGGALSGGGNILLNNTMTRMRAEEMFKDGDYRGIAEGIDDAEETYKNKGDRDVAKEAKELATELADRYEKGEKISGRDKTKLLNLIDETIKGAQKAQEPKRETSFDRLANMFNDLVDAQDRGNNEATDNAGQSIDNVAQKTDNASQENRRVAPVQSDITQDEVITRMSKAKTAEELGAVYNEAKNSTHEDVRKMADNLYDTYAGKLQSEGVSPEELRQGRISEQKAYEAGREGKDIGRLNLKQAEAYQRGAQEAFREENEVTAKGAEAVTNDGSRVEISKIVDTTEGKIETSDGTVLPMTGIRFEDKGMQKLYNAAMEYHSPSAAQVFIEAYPTGVPVNSYITAANEVYNRGRLGISLGDYLSRRGWLANRLGQETIDRLYNAGKAEKEATSRENKSMEGKKAAKGGHVIDTRENKDKSHPMYRLAKDMSDKLGVDIELTENDSKENGSYNPQKARIILNMNSDNGVFNTFFHETVGEYTEAWNKNGMTEIQDLILDWWMSTHPEEMDNLIKRYQDAYMRHEGSKSYREASNEAVNDALAGLFSTPEGINDFVEWLEADTKNNVQTQTVLERIANFIKDLIDKLNNYIKGHPEISTASRSTMQMSADQAAGLRARILDVLDTARANAAQAETVENADQEEVRHSVKVIPDNINEIIEQNRGTVKDMDPVATVSGDTFAKKEGVSLIDQVEEYYNSIGNVATNDILGDVVLNRRGIKDSISHHKLYRNKAVMFKAVPEIIEKGLIIDYQKNWKHRSYDSAVIVAPVNIDDTECITAVIVQRNESSQRFYLHETIEIEKGLLFKTGTSPDRGISTPGNNPLSIFNILAKYASVKAQNTGKVSDTAHSLVVDSEGRELSEGQQEFFADESPLLLDEKGALKRYYHGTARIDRVGTVFNPARATSGPMAFFTDDKSIAENYAKDKSDTSISRDDRYDSYYTQFRLNIDGKEYSVPEAWNRLPASKRIEIKKKAEHITFDDDYEEIIYDPNNKNGLGNFDAYILREHRGNYLEALVDSWLESGDLFGQEERFPEVLKLAGLDNVQYLNPDERNEGVYEVYLHMANPFNTSDISKEDINAIREAAKKAEYDAGQVSADMWDKNNQTPEHWLERFEDDIKEGSSHSWTSIPDWVTEALKQQGYDGIIDKGGKYHEVEHQVAIPFSSEQIKSIDNDNPTENPDIRYSLSGIDTDILSGPIKHSIGDDVLYEMLNGTLEEATFADEDPGSAESYRHNIDSTITNLSRMLEAANAPLRGHSVDYQRIGKIADRIKSEYNSHISKQVLTNNLTTVFDYLQNNENIDYDDITRLLTEIAAPVLEKTGVEVPEAYQHFKQYVRTIPIKLSEQQKQELAYTYGSYDSARKQNFGRINFSDEGTPIDRIWPELVRESAGLLDEATNAGDIAHMLIDAVENCDHGYSELEIERGQNMAEASIDLAIDIMEEYYKAEADAIRSEAVNGVLESGMAGAAARESIDKARAQMKRQQEEFRKKTKEEYDARIRALEIEAGQVDYYKAMADYNETVRKIEGQKSKAEIHRLITELANTRRDLAIKTKALQKDSVMDYKMRQDAAKTRKEITRIGNDLMKRILEPTSKKHVPTDLQKPLAEFLSGIDFVSHRSKEDSKNTKTWRERMQTLSIYLSQLEDGRIEDDLGLQAVLDPDLNADIRDFIKETEGYARVSQLDAKHLKDLLGILKRLQVAINKSDTLYLNNTYKKVSDLAVATRNELEKKKTRRPMFTMQGIAYNTANISMLDPTSYFEEMGEAPKSIFKSLRDGFDQRAWHLKDAQEYMKKVLEGISQKDLAQWSRDKYTFNVSDGEITLTITQIMSLYELMKRDQAREHIMRGGIKADVREEGRWLKKSYTQNKPVHITPENFLTIIGKLTDEQKEVADAMQRFMATQCAEWGNHTTEQMYGYKKFTEKNYYPIKTDKNTIAANDKNTGDNGSLYHLRNLGMTKDLTPHAKNAIVLSDIFNVFSDHVADMATYDGMVMPLSDAMRWFNFKVTSEIMDEAAEFGSINDMWSIQEEIERVLGAPGKAYFTNLIKDINGMTPKAYDTQLADKLISNYKAAAVGANVRVIVQQPTAILRAANEMSPKYLARVLNPVTIAQSGKLAQKAKDYSAIAWWKGQGYFETSIGQSMRQMITGEATMGETIREYANKGAQVADDLTWGLIWRATELEIKDKRPELEYGSKEFYDAVTERFNEIVDKTQVVDTVLHRTQLMRSKSDINKLEMAFMAEPMKSYNMLHRAWKSGNKKTLARAATTFVLTNILTAAAAAIVDAFRKDDDETPWLDRYLTALKENIIDNLNPLNMFPYLKDVSSAMQGFENGRMDIEGINNLVQSLGQLEKFVKGESKKTPYGMLKSLSKGISQLSGIPAYSLIRTFESIYNTFFDNLQTTVTSDYSYAYTAIDKNGDIEGEIQKLIDKGKNPDSIAAALTKHYKNEYAALSEEERPEMKEKLLRAYEAAGKDYEKNIDKWVMDEEKAEEAEPVESSPKNNSQDASQNEEVAPVQEEYTSDYAGVYNAIDKGGDIQAEVQNMLDSGKQKSGVKSAITRHYKDDYLATTGSEKANMKNTLIKAYTAAGYTREEAISTIEGW